MPAHPRQRARRGRSQRSPVAHRNTRARAYPHGPNNPRHDGHANNPPTSSDSTRAFSAHTINMGATSGIKRALPTQRSSWREGSRAFTNARSLPASSRPRTARASPPVPKSSGAQHMLLNQPLVDAPGGMTLLTRRQQVRIQPRIDQRPKRPQLRRRTTLRPTLRRRHRRLKRLPDRSAMNPMTLRQRMNRQPFSRVIAPDLLELLHSGHPFRLPASRSTRALSVSRRSDRGGASSSVDSGAR